jgi:hypothetical protein
MKILVVMMSPSRITLVKGVVASVMPAPATFAIEFASKDALPSVPIEERVVNAPVVAFFETDWNPFSERTGPLKVVFAMSISCRG